MHFLSPLRIRAIDERQLHDDDVPLDAGHPAPGLLDDDWREDGRVQEPGHAADWLSLWRVREPGQRYGWAGPEQDAHSLGGEAAMKKESKPAGAGPASRSPYAWRAPTSSCEG